MGDNIDEYIILRIIKVFYCLGYFDNIKVLCDGNSVIFCVIECLMISMIEFDGNKDIKDE